MTFKSSLSNLAKDEHRFPAQPVDDEDQKDVRGDLDERSEDEGDVDVAAQVDRVEAEPVGPHGRRYPVGEQDQRVGGHCSIWKQKGVIKVAVLRIWRRLTTHFALYSKE